MGLEHSYAVSGLRVSLSPEHTDRDIAFFVQALKKVIAQLGGDSQ